MEKTDLYCNKKKKNQPSKTFFPPSSSAIHNKNKGIEASEYYHQTEKSLDKPLSGTKARLILCVM